MQIAVRNFFVATGFFAIAGFYYWINWSSEMPILGGDHAIYLLAADFLSPFSNQSHDIALAAMPYTFFPPLYPLVLAITGGTSAHVEIAHTVTVSLLIASLAWFFVLARQETRNFYQSFLIAAIFALLPTTFLQSFGILSENLYLLLTLIALWLLSKPDVPVSRFYIASVIVGLAAVTRTIGITMVMAFAIHLYLHGLCYTATGQATPCPRLPRKTNF